MSASYPHADTARDRRRHGRSAVLLGAMMRDGKASETELGSRAILFNVSRGGAMLRVIDPFAVQNTVELDIDRVGKVAARIIWRGSDALGITFRDTPAVIERRFSHAADLRAAG